MNSFCDSGYEALHGAKSSGDGTGHHRRHSRRQVIAKLDDCLVMLADGHDQVMHTMIKELYDIVNDGHPVGQDAEPQYQGQDDHPLSQLSCILQLSGAAMASLACTDSLTLEELSTKVVLQQARITSAESILAPPWHMASPKLHELNSQGGVGRSLCLLPRCAHQCQAHGCVEQCIYDTHHSQSVQPGTTIHRCKEQDAGEICKPSAESASLPPSPTNQRCNPSGKYLEPSQVRPTSPSEAITGSGATPDSQQLIGDNGGEDVTQGTNDIDPWLTSSIPQHRQGGEGKGSMGPLDLARFGQQAPNGAATHHQAPALTIWENFATWMITVLHRLHSVMAASVIRSLSAMLDKAGTWRCSKNRDGPLPEEAIVNSKDITTKDSEVPQESASPARHATFRDRHQDSTGRMDQLGEPPLREKQAGSYTTHTQCLECCSLVELDDVGYEEELCDSCMSEAIERYWGPTHADYSTEDDSASRGPHGDA